MLRSNQVQATEKLDLNGGSMKNRGLLNWKLFLDLQKIGEFGIFTS